MKICATQSYPETQSTKSATAARPVFKQIKVVPTYFDSFERVLRNKRDVYKFEAIKENLTKVYIDCCSYYNMHFNIPTIEYMLDAPDEYEVSVDYLHMYM